MMVESFFSRQQKDPEGLLRLHVATAVVSAVIIAVLSAFSFYRIFSGFVINDAKEDSLQLCRWLCDQQSRNLLPYLRPRGETPDLGGQHLAQLDQEMRELLRPFNILRSKIYDANRRIVYSTEASGIGKDDAANHHLAKALAGGVEASQLAKGMAPDLADEPRLDVDVVETYVPIRGTNGQLFTVAPPGKADTGKVLGSFEIYLDVSKYGDQVRAGVEVMTAITVAVLAAVFGLSFLLIRRGTLQLKAAQAKLQELATTDVLTGIANRGHVMARGEEEFTRAERNTEKGVEAATLCCIMLDVDNFKHINDTLGHPAGDEVLREVVRRLRQSVRPYDIVGRYGGEEFLLLLPDTLFEEGVAVAERIRADVRKTPFAVGRDAIPVSVSLGISCLDETDRTLDDLLKRSDEGLYKAKQAGRDRVAWVRTLLGPPCRFLTIPMC